MIVLVMSMYLVQGTLNGLNPAMSALTEHFSNYEQTTVMLIATIPCLTAILGNMAMSTVIRKFGYKLGLIATFIFYFITSILPYFTFDNLIVVLAERGLMGLAYGILYPVCATMVATFISPEKQGTYMGLGTTMGALAGVLFSTVGGMLTDISLQSIFFVHLLSLIPFVLLLLTPNSFLTVSSNSVVEGGNSNSVGTKAKEKFGPKSWFWQIFIAFALIFAYGFYLNSSLVVTKLGGNASQAGLAVSVNLIAGCVASTSFGKVYKILDKAFMSVSCFVAAMGYLLVFTAHSIPVLLAGAALAGLGYNSLTPYMFTAIAMTTPASRVADANGNAAALMNVSAVICTYILNFLAGLFGRAGDAQFVFVFSVAFFIILGVAFAFVGNKLVQNNKIKEGE